ncbi:MAG: TolC family protein [Lachnospiraceae bacterium]|nr:TolC family protein [Lachnospiraceae bacterium]
MISGFSTVPVTVYARNQKLDIKTARQVALVNSDKYDAAVDKIDAKQAAYNSKVKSLSLKKTNLTTFRWSPLLSFTFPQQLNEAQSAEFDFTPVSLQYDISVAEHKAKDTILTVYQDVNNVFVDIVAGQKKIAFNERRLESVESNLKRNKVKLAAGTANQADIDKMEAKQKSLTSTIAADRRTLEANLKKLSKLMGKDISTGYDFAPPYIDTKLTRDQLDPLIQYAMDRDETVYEARIAEASKKIELKTNYDLFQRKYSGDINIISSYVQAALNGGEVDKKAFKKAYKDFLNKIDSYWEGKKRILFFKFPRLWFKGSLDGTRYIEDDSGVVQTLVNDMVTAMNDREAAEDDLTTAVTDGFNNYVSVKNSYQQFKTDLDKAEQNLDKSYIKNQLGEMTFEEYDSELQSYEDLQNQYLDSMKLYTKTLHELDRTTCGGVSAILDGTDADMQTAKEGESYVEKSKTKLHYTLKPIIEKFEFELTLSKPEDFPIEVTDYELWADKTQIGERMPFDKSLRHLMLTTTEADRFFVRLYDGDKFIDDCDFDPEVESGDLEVISDLAIKKNEGEVVGTYEIVSNEETGFMDITLKLDDEKVKKYQFTDENGNKVGASAPLEIEKPLRHLGLVETDLGTLTVEFFDEGGTSLYKARLDTQNVKVKKLVDEEE